MGKKKDQNKVYTSPYEFEGRIPLKKAIPLGLQHVLAMFVGNLTPLLIITNLCAAIGGGEDLIAMQVTLLQNAMLMAGVVTLIQLYAVGPVGGKVPIIMGTSSGFIGVFQSVANVVGGGVTAYGAMMGASITALLFFWFSSYASSRLFTFTYFAILIKEFYASFLSFGRQRLRRIATIAAGTMPEPPKISLTFSGS